MIKNFFASIGRHVERHTVIAVLVFVLAFSTVCMVKIKYEGSLGGDAKEYVRTAYYLANQGVYSSSPDRDNPEPAYRRPPGYPLFLAGMIKLFPQLRHNDFNWMFPPKGQKPKPDPVLIPIKYVQALMLLVTALITAWMVWDFTRRLIPSYLTLWFIGFHPFLERYVDRLYREVLSGFLIAVFSLFLYLALKRRKLVYYLLSGLALGALTLTLAQWKYVGAAGIACVAICTVLERKQVVKGLLGVVLMSVAWVAVFYPWELRNERLFGHKFLSAGGGAVLEVRSLYNLMPLSSYLSTFAYWSRSPVLKNGLLHFVDKKYYVPLMRDEEEGYYHIAKSKRMELVAEKGFLGADLILKKESIERIKAHPVRHLLMTIPVGFRLMMNPMFSVFYIGVYALFCLAVWKAVRRGDWILTALFASPFMLFAFNALATHGLPRYNGHAAPLLIFGAVTGWCFIKDTGNSGGNQFSLRN